MLLQKIKLFFIFILININYIIGQYNYDLTVFGYVNYNDGLGRLPIIFMDMYDKFNFKINFIFDPNIKSYLENIPINVRSIIDKEYINVGKVFIMFSQVWHPIFSNLENIPNGAIIKIAYSMIECSDIPKQWVDIFNENFDLIVVPDNFVKEVYTNSGVKKPIFVLPIPLYLEDFLNTKLDLKKSDKFNFGVSCRFVDHKNYKLLIRAFIHEFKNNKNVNLIIHGRAGDIPNLFLKRVEKYNNIKIIDRQLNHSEYISFFSNLNCYILISKGEGFSITPREALALGIPCILSNNTAHRTICETGYVLAIESGMPEEAYKDYFGFACGLKYNCKLSDVCRAMRFMYNNYEIFLKKAKEGREWTKQYLLDNLSGYYNNLIKPKNIFFI